MATAYEKAFENMTPEQREQVTKGIGEMIGMPCYVQEISLSILLKLY